MGVWGYPPQKEGVAAPNRPADDRVCQKSEFPMLASHMPLALWPWTPKETILALPSRPEMLWALLAEVAFSSPGFVKASAEEKLGEGPSRAEEWEALSEDSQN